MSGVLLTPNPGVVDEKYALSLGEIPEEPKTDPNNYNEVIQDKDATLWQKIMNTEMKSMYYNQVWTLVDAPDGVKPIGSKWIYKR